MLALVTNCKKVDLLSSTMWKSLRRTCSNVIPYFGRHPAPWMYTTEKKNQCGTDLEAFSVTVTFHSSRTCCVVCLGGEGEASLVLLSYKH